MGDQPRRNPRKRSPRKRKRRNDDDEEQPLDLSFKTSSANQQRSAYERQGCSTETTHGHREETTSIQPQILVRPSQPRLNTRPRASGSSVYRPSAPSLISLIRQQRSHTSTKLYDDVTMETAQTLLRLKDSISPSQHTSTPHRKNADVGNALRPIYFAENHPLENIQSTSRENDNSENMPSVQPINRQENDTLENISALHPTSQENVDFGTMPILSPISNLQPTNNQENGKSPNMRILQPVTSGENNPFANMPPLIPIPESILRRAEMLNKRSSSGTSRRYRPTNANNSQTLVRRGNQQSSTAEATFTPTTIQPDQQQVTVPRQQSVIMTPILLNRLESPSYLHQPMQVINSHSNISGRHLRAGNDIQPRNESFQQSSVARELYQPIPLNEFPETHHSEPAVRSQSLNNANMRTSLDSYHQTEHQFLKPAPPLKIQKSTSVRSRRQSKQFTSSKSRLMSQKSVCSGTKYQSQQLSFSEVRLQTQQAVPPEQFNSSELNLQPPLPILSQQFNSSGHILQPEESNPLQQFSSSGLSLQLQQAIPARQFNASELSLELQQQFSSSGLSLQSHQIAPPQQFNSSELNLPLQQSLPQQQFNSSELNLQLQQSLLQQQFNSSELNLQLQQSLPQQHFNSSELNLQLQQSLPQQQFNSSELNLQLEQSLPQQQFNSSELNLQLQQYLPEQQFNSSELNLQSQQQFNSSEYSLQLQQIPQFNLPPEQTIPAQNFCPPELNLQLNQSLPSQHFSSPRSRFQSQQTISSRSRIEVQQSATSESSHRTQMVQPLNVYSSHPSMLSYDAEYSTHAQMARPFTAYSTQHPTAESNEFVPGIMQNSSQPYLSQHSSVSSNNPTTIDTNETASRTRSSSAFRPQMTQTRNDTSFRMPASYFEPNEVSQYTNSTSSSPPVLISNESTQRTQLSQFSISRTRSQVSQRRIEHTPMLRTPPYYYTRWRQHTPRLLTESQTDTYNPSYPPPTTINQRSETQSSFNESQQRPLLNVVYPQRMTPSVSVQPQRLRFMNGSLRQNSSQFAVVPTVHESQSTTHLNQFAQPVTPFGYWPQNLQQYNSDSILHQQQMLSGPSFNTPQQRHTTSHDDHSAQSFEQPAFAQDNEDMEDPNNWDLDINKIWELLQSVNFDLSDEAD